MPAARMPATVPFTIASSGEYAPTHGVNRTRAKVHVKLPRKARIGESLRHAVVNTPAVSAITSIGNTSALNAMLAAV